jgi:hypothetical protein
LPVNDEACGAENEDARQKIKQRDFEPRFGEDIDRQAIF